MYFDMVILISMRVGVDEQGPDPEFSLVKKTE
jgi:hypothetical protein